MAKHEEKPQIGDLPDDVMEQAFGRLSSSYGERLQALLDEIRGKVVARTSAGRSGYCLEFSDRTWIICHLSDFVLEWHTGSGLPSADDRALMHDQGAGDGRGPLTIDRPYADEICDLEAQVACCVGQPVSAVAVGDVRQREEDQCTLASTAYSPP
jgi:hypothetical protein